MARPKKESADGMVSGRALVDIPALSAKCGEYIDVPAELAKAYEDAGEFDPKAQKPQE